MILLSIALHHNHRGRGLWRLNTSLLKDEEYIEQIKIVIDQTRKAYELNDTVNPALLWDVIKMKVREKSVSYAASKNSRIKMHEDILHKQMADLEKIRDEGKFSNEEQKVHLQTKIDDYINEIERIIEHRTRGAMLRSRTRWHGEVEKNTKYFLNLEKRQCKQGTKSRLKRNENDYATTDKENLHVCETFYKALYASKLESEHLPSLTDVFFSDNYTVLSCDESEVIGEDILSKVECLKALKEMKSRKSPSTDGLPVEFYEHFWNVISEPLLAALNYGFTTGNLSITQRRGIIKLIPKRSEELFYVRNWRPLTLLNCDYKIAAKAIVNRIKIYLPKLVNNDQTGFIKGRCIFENIRLIDIVISYQGSNNIAGLLLRLDFEKAFDTLEWPFMEKTLLSFNFGSCIIQWFKTLYNCSESCIVNNGWISGFLSVNRGVRQGCPLSPYLFILSVEILAKSIRKNTDIKGLQVKNTEIKISQYADDTTLILDGSQKSLIEALKEPRNFSKISGLRLNSKKTERY